MQQREVPAEKSEMEEMTSSDGSDSDSDALEEFTKKFMGEISNRNERKADKHKPNESDLDDSDTDEGTDSDEENEDLSAGDDDSKKEEEDQSESDSDNEIAAKDSPRKKSDRTLKQQTMAKSKQDLVSSRKAPVGKRLADSETPTSDNGTDTSDDESDGGSDDRDHAEVKKLTNPNDTDSDSVGSGPASGDGEGDQQSPSDEEGSSPGDTADTSTAEFEKLRQELANLPFTELQKLKETIGIKAYNQAMFGTTSRTSSKKKNFTRENKNRPSELSSKRSVPRFREVVQVKKKTSRDPRFDDLSGEFDEKVFKQSYSFLGDIKQREKQKLLSTYHKEKDEDKKKQMQNLIRRMNQQDRAEREKEDRLSKEQTRKRREMEQVKQGKQPFHLKKAEKRKLDLAEKFRELEKSGKVDKYLAKRRKKNASKDRKHLPNKHFVS